MVMTFLLGGMIGLGLNGIPARMSQPDHQHPLIKDHGRVVDPAGTAAMPQSGAKVVLDITADRNAGRPADGLDRAAMLYNLYAAAGVPPERIRVTVVLHGEAVRAALTDDAYARYAADGPNPNLELIRRLRQAGAEVYVCRQALARHGYTIEQVSPEVTVAASAATVNISRQMDGYAYLPFH